LLYDSFSHAAAAAGEAFSAFWRSSGTSTTQGRVEGQLHVDRIAADDARFLPFGRAERDLWHSTESMKVARPLHF
jgi:hypothetical protein